MTEYKCVISRTQGPVLLRSINDIVNVPSSEWRMKSLLTSSLLFISIQFNDIINNQSLVRSWSPNYVSLQMKVLTKNCILTALNNLDVGIKVEYYEESGFN